MAIESPLFQSSMELFGHSITHFNGTSELDRKLVIIHLSNAIELLLKDMVLDGGDSIYKNPKETITIHACFESLKARNISIPYLNKLELLIDERNALQHRFGSPNELTAIFYMNIAQDFFRDVLRNHYGQDFDELLPEFSESTDLVALKMREPADDSELENLKKLGKVHPLGALLSAIAYLERTILKFATTVGVAERFSSALPVSVRYLEINGIELPQDLRDRLDKTRRIRNLAAHGKAEPTKQDVVDVISSIEDFERFLAKLDIDAVREQVIFAREKREAERKNYENRVLFSADQWMHEELKDYLMKDPALGKQTFMIDVKDHKVSISKLPESLPGDAKVFIYKFSLNDRGDNISTEARRIKEEIARDCLVG